MKIFSIFLVCLFCLATAGGEGMTPEDDVKIYNTWWGESFHQNGSELKVTSMYPVLDSYESSRDWAKKSRYYYVPSMILAGGGVLMMVVPPVSNVLGNKFSTGMFLGGIGFTAIGMGLFKLSNVYLGRAVRKYKQEHDTGGAHLKIDIEATYEGARLVGNFSF